MTTQDNYQDDYDTCGYCKHARIQYNDLRCFGAKSWMVRTINNTYLCSVLKKERGDNDVACNSFKRYKPECTCDSVDEVHVDCCNLCILGDDENTK